ncbi:MAG: threonine synthase [Lachnospiraceae bacterium]|nr:threonine synthase [Lachnospiraceae bacterium]MBQ6835312.1 threonine synthase [Lachnospiraceae bacterium]
MSKNLYYTSTRGGEKHVTASQAILKGLATDGGLFVPEEIPKLDVTLDTLAAMNYQETAHQVMKQFLTDFTEEELKYCISHAYDEKFDTKEIAPLRKAGDAYYLELFHGKTIAFKDMALSILPYFMTTAAKKNGVKNEIVILTATSGDTGKAAMAGFADVPGTRIIVFYPKDGVSRVQELQMLTQKGENTCVVGIEGNFDDAQTGVKKIFGDKTFAEEIAEMGYQFSSANSINIGRLVPQIVYYVYAYAKLYAAGEIAKDEPVNVVVPTGNFGNILAAYFAKQMGIPFDKLICASNDNKVLYDFFTTGEYDKNRDFILTSSPSMDILVSSNLERLLYLSCGRDAEQTKNRMESLAKDGKYEITAEMKEFMSDFRAGYADMQANAKTIKTLFDETGYLIDTHTGVAAAVHQAYKAATDDQTKTIIASTASPYKFSRSVVEAVCGKQETADEFALINKMERLSGVKIPQAIEEIRNAEIRHQMQCKPEDMKQTVKEILKR